MAEKLNFAFLLVCIIILAVRLEILSGRISRLKGMVETMLMRDYKEREGGGESE